MVFGPSRRVARRTARRTSRRQMAMYQSQEPEYDEPEPQQYQAAPPPAQPDYAAELQKLASLRDQGVITPEEFEAKKRQVLGI
jgi:hypothetical protein